MKKRILNKMFLGVLSAVISTSALTAFSTKVRAEEDTDWTYIEDFSAESFDSLSTAYGKWERYTYAKAGTTELENGALKLTCHDIWNGSYTLVKYNFANKVTKGLLNISYRIKPDMTINENGNALVTAVRADSNSYTNSDGKEVDRNTLITASGLNRYAGDNANTDFRFLTGTDDVNQPNASDFVMLKKIESGWYDVDTSINLDAKVYTINISKDGELLKTKIFGINNEAKDQLGDYYTGITIREWGLLDGTVYLDDLKIEHIADTKTLVDENDYDYSFAVVGDFQTITYNDTGRLPYINDWIIQNAKNKKMKWVFNLGDMTDKYNDWEWKAARSAIRNLDTVLPYSIIRGNHDSRESFNKYFPYEDYADRVNGTFSGDMLNTYQKFKVGDTKYLVLNLDFGVEKDAVDWANGIVESNPDYNVIVTTHGYLKADGKRLTGSDEYAPSWYKEYPNGYDGDDLWNELISKHSNIVLVLSGHTTAGDIIVNHATGINGNDVTEMLIDPQEIDKKGSPQGVVAMLYFSNDGRTVRTDYYSTINNTLIAKGQTIELNKVEASAEDEVKKISSISNISFDVTLDGVTQTVSQSAESDTVENTEETTEEITSQTPGTVYAALYSDSGVLKGIKVYPAANKVHVAFDETSEGDYVKVMWWTGDNYIVPVSTSKIPISTYR